MLMRIALLIILLVCGAALLAHTVAPLLDPPVPPKSDLERQP